MPTGAFWNVSNPTKPWGLWDPDAQLPIFLDWTDWLTDEGATYVSHTIEFPEGVLAEVSSDEISGVIRVLIKLIDPAVFVSGKKYPVTCHIQALSSGLTLKDDRTVYLKVKER